MAADWMDVGSADAVADSASISVDLDGLAVLVVRCGADFFALEDRCTHDGAPLEGGAVEDCRIVCPRHGAHFCVRTGEALTPPAYEPVRTFPVRIESGRILVQNV